eukprot:jgi/Ulvmu1/7647/UM038_0076.1
MPEKPQRLGKLEKTRRFAPKRPVKKEPKATPKSTEASAASGAGPSNAGDDDDPFAALMRQAEAAKGPSRKPLSRTNRGSKFQVAFGESGQQSFGSWDQITKAKAPGQAGGSGGGGARGASKAAAKGIKNENGEIIFPDEDMADKPAKVREPLFDRESYYPVTIPFRHVDHPHDPNVAMDAGLPEDLSTQVPEELPVAQELGLTHATPDGVVALLQLPPLMPSVTLFEAAERAALEAPTSESQPLPEGTKPKPKFHRGPELLRALPSGRIGTLQVMKSGKVYLKVGSARYLMRPGIEHSHRTELHVVNMKTSDMVMVAGDCPTAAACLDLEALLLAET